MTSPEPIRFESVEDLLAHLGADSLEEAGELLSENLEPDAFLEDDGDLVLRMGTQGATLEFPMTSDGFWELVRDLEQGVIADMTVGSWPAHSRGELLYWHVDALFPENEPARVAKYRRLQSWYRERVLRARPGAFMNYEALGSYLHADEMKDRPDLNFLNGAAFAHAEERAAQVKSEGGHARAKSAPTEPALEHAAVFQPLWRAPGRAGIPRPLPRPVRSRGHSDLGRRLRVGPATAVRAPR